MTDDFSKSIKRTIAALRARNHIDPMQCELCDGITDLMEAKTRRQRRNTDLGNSIQTELAEWQCKHCLAWNEP